ncbi:MAG: hypothetical protein O3B41_01320 [Bacteroidetes bacterium]|nr:hypothetical protein [Bacteroidota bacterium]
MNKELPPPSLSAGVICVALGLIAWSNFIGEITSGNLDLLNFETLLFPIGIGLIQPGVFWIWVARIQLFALALYSGTILVGFLFMSDQTKFLVYEFHNEGGSLSGTGIVLFLQSLFFVGILWVYFSNFAGRKIAKSINPIQIN